MLFFCSRLALPEVNFLSFFSSPSPIKQPFFVFPTRFHSLPCCQKKKKSLIFLQNNLDQNNNKNELDEEEAERDHIFGMLNRGGHVKRNEPFEAEHPIVPPAFQGDVKANNAPQPPPLRVNVEDKLAGRDSANENHQFLEDKVPQEMMIGQNLEDSKDLGDPVKKNHKGNKRQKINRNHGFDSVLIADEKELQVRWKELYILLIQCISTLQLMKCMQTKGMYVFNFRVLRITYSSAHIY